MYGPGNPEFDMKKGWLLGPVVDKAGQPVNSKFINELSKAMYGVKHIGSVLTGWENNAATRDRAAMLTLKETVLDAKENNPEAFSDPVTMQGLDNIVQRIDKILPPPPAPPEHPVNAPHSPEAHPVGRNSFEKALVAWNFPARYAGLIEHYVFPDDPDGAKMREAMRVKKAFIFTRIFAEIINKIDWSTPTLKDPAHALEFLDGTTLNTAQLFQSIDDHVSRDEAEVAADFKKDMESTLAVLKEMIDLFSEIKSASGKMRNQQLPDKMIEIYTKMHTFGNVDRLEIFAGLPKLMDVDGNETLYSIADLLHGVAHETIKNGHEWVTDARTGWVYEAKQPWIPGVPSKRGANWVIESRDPDVASDKLVLYSPMYGKNYVRRPGKPGIGLSPLPEDEAGKESNNKTPLLLEQRDRLHVKQLGLPDTVHMEDLTDEQKAELKRAPGARVAELSANIVAALNYQLMVVWGEADGQDNVYDSSRGRGAPVGWSFLARVLNSELYAQKTAELGSVDSKTNPFIVGRMKKAGVSYLDFVVTNTGQTLKQAFMTSRGWDDLVEGTKTIMVQKASLNWVAHLTRAINEYFMAESINEGSLLDIATVDFAEGQVRNKPDAIKKLFDRIRNALEYHEATDLAAGAVLQDPQRDVMNAFEAPVDSVQHKTRRLPSEEFFEIVLVDERLDLRHEAFLRDPNAVDYESYVIDDEEEVNARAQGRPAKKKKGRYITRFPSHYVVTPVRLAAWLQDPTRDSTPGDKRAYKNGLVFNRKVMRVNAQRNQFEYTGQVDRVILIQVKDAQARSYNQEVKKLVQRLHVEYILEMAGLPSDVVPKLKKSDWLPLGLFLSEEMRQNYQKGHYGKLSDLVRGQISERFHEITGLDFMEFIAREDSGILGRDLFSEAQFTELLDRMGYKITVDDWQTTFDLLSETTGLPKLTVPGVKPSSGAKH